MFGFLDAIAPRALGALAAFIVGKVGEKTGIIVDPVSLGTALLGVYAVVHRYADSQLTKK